jgi:hypothetical protein
MTLLVHGEAGGWDELLIALVAFGVMWIAVKLAGRKPAADDHDESEAAVHPASVDIDQEHAAPVPPPATKLS